MICLNFPNVQGSESYNTPESYTNKIAFPFMNHFKLHAVFLTIIAGIKIRDKLPTH